MLENYEIIIASDVHKRDGIGVEIWKDGKLLLEVFRNDGIKKRTISLFEDNLTLSLIEETIAYFKKEIPHEFLD
jgi:hypothetical protein